MKMDNQISSVRCHISLAISAFVLVSLTSHCENLNALGKPKFLDNSIGRVRIRQPKSIDIKQDAVGEELEASSTAVTLGRVYYEPSEPQESQEFASNLNLALLNSEHDRFQAVKSIVNNQPGNENSTSKYMIIHYIEPIWEACLYPYNSFR